MGRSHDAAIDIATMVIGIEEVADLMLGEVIVFPIGHPFQKNEYLALV